MTHSLDSGDYAQVVYFAHHGKHESIQGKVIDMDDQYLSLRMDGCDYHIAWSDVYSIGAV